MDLEGITTKNKFEKYKKNTNQFINELESTLRNFENSADVIELYSKIQESVKRFQEESND